MTICSQMAGQPETAQGIEPPQATQARVTSMLSCLSQMLVRPQLERYKPPDSTNGSKEPNGNHWPPSDKSYLWNDDIHKNIIEECNQQDCTNWEHKLEALAHLLSVAEAKQAIAVCSTSVLCEILVLRSGTCLSQCQ